MEVYSIEREIVEQERKLDEIRIFVEETAQGMQIHEIEKGLFSMMLELGRSLLEEAVARNGTGKEEGEIVKENGNILKYHSTIRRNYLSIFGEIQIMRAYYWDKGEEGRYPLDEKLNLPQRQHSYLLEQWLMQDIAETPYQEVKKKFKEILGIEVWNGEQILEVFETAANTEEYYRWKGIPVAQVEGPVICATADCKGVRMVTSEKPEKAKTQENRDDVRLGKGEKTGLRKDAVVTCDYTFIPEERSPDKMFRILMRKQTQEDIDQEKNKRDERKRLNLPEPRAPLNKQLFATMYGKENAFENLADRIQRRDPKEKKNIYILIDGEKSLETGILKEFKKRGWEGRIAGVCLDIFHVTEYIWDAATSLYGEKSSEREAWVCKELQSILEGNVGRVTGGLRQILTKRGCELSLSQKKTLNRVITYFDNHRDMMSYDVFLSAGFPIGSGIIEGACGSLVKDRMDGSGKRWTKQGAQAILNLRSIKRNGDWHPFWQFHIAQQKQKLYEKSA